MINNYYWKQETASRDCTGVPQKSEYASKGDSLGKREAKFAINCFSKTLPEEDICPLEDGHQNREFTISSK